MAALLIPQGMPYASIAGLPPIVGLYCYAPLIVYALLGSSPHISVTLRWSWALYEDLALLTLSRWDLKVQC